MQPIKNSLGLPVQQTPNENTNHSGIINTQGSTFVLSTNSNENLKIHQLPPEILFKISSYLGKEDLTHLLSINEIFNAGFNEFNFKKMMAGLSFFEKYFFLEEQTNKISETSEMFIILKVFLEKLHDKMTKNKDISISINQLATNFPDPSLIPHVLLNEMALFISGKDYSSFIAKFIPDINDQIKEELLLRCDSFKFEPGINNDVLICYFIEYIEIEQKYLGLPFEVCKPDFVFPPKLIFKILKNSINLQKLVKSEKNNLLQDLVSLDTRNKQRGMELILNHNKNVKFSNIISNSAMTNLLADALLPRLNMIDIDNLLLAFHLTRHDILHNISSVSDEKIDEIFDLIWVRLMGPSDGSDYRNWLIATQ